MFDLNFLGDLRARELDLSSAYIRPGSKVLEFGAGAGTQARDLQRRGFNVVAIDLGNSAFSLDRVFPVIDYDGRHIPLPDQSIDVIFSSNVLEHVDDLNQILAEFRRILAPGGYCVHIMPSVAWRAWTFATGVPTAMVASWCAIRDMIMPPPAGRVVALRRNFKVIASGLLFLGHGTSVEGISELWTFSIPAWRSKFKAAGFSVDAVMPVGVFHTGHMMLGSRLPLARRERLAQRFGSAAHLYIVCPEE